MPGRGNAPGSAQGAKYPSLNLRRELPLLIAIFLIPTAFMMHAFWKETDATAKQNETTGFFKDLALAGAALVFFALLRGGAAFGPHVGTLLAFKK